MTGPVSPGRWLERAGNGTPLDRWLSKQNPAYRLLAPYLISKGPRGPAPAGAWWAFERHLIPVPGRRSAMSIPVITISREYGSGGRAIGEKAGKGVGDSFLQQGTDSNGSQGEWPVRGYIKKAEQQKSTSFLYGLYMGAQQLPMNDQIFLIQSKIIREIAEKGPASLWAAAPTMSCGSGRTCSVCSSMRRCLSGPSAPRRCMREDRQQHRGFCEEKRTRSGRLSTTISPRINGGRPPLPPGHQQCVRRGLCRGGPQARGGILPGRGGSVSGPVQPPQENKMGSCPSDGSF